MLPKFVIIIITNLLNEERLVQKLSESYPMRRAAQLLVYFLNKNKPTALEFKNLSQLQGSSLAERLKKIAEELEKKKKKLE